jgi:hypothetical protein
MRRCWSCYEIDLCKPSWYDLSRYDIAMWMMRLERWNFSPISNIQSIKIFLKHVISWDERDSLKVTNVIQFSSSSIVMYNSEGDTSASWFI